MKEVLLILLGASISCGTTFFIDWIKFKRDEKTYFKRKKEEAYNKFSMICIKLKLLETINQEEINNDKTFNELTNSVAQLAIYAPSVIKNKICRYKLKDFNEKKLEEMIELFRKDLKIED